MCPPFWTILCKYLGKLLVLDLYYDFFDLKQKKLRYHDYIANEYSKMCSILLYAYARSVYFSRGVMTIIDSLPRDTNK